LTESNAAFVVQRLSR